MSNSPDCPYLSVVTSSRNDDHGSRMFNRMQVALSSMVAQLERYELNSEIILVDYNPPPEKPLLKEVLSWPRQTKYCTIRTIIVPPSIHRRYKISDRLNFSGEIAQNVGLRRARGKFVLLATVGILFANELIEFISKENLEKDKTYRTDRHDVSRDVLEIPSLDDRLSFCRGNVIWIHTRYGSVPVVRAKKHHLRSGNLDFDVKDRKLPKLHTNGTDFLLMSRESWHLLRGYPEVDTFGLGFDALPCYTAYLAGIKEQILPELCRIYHIDHNSLWRDTRPSLLERILFYWFPDMIAIRMASVFRLACRFVPSNLLRKKTKIESLGFDYSSFQKAKEIVLEMQSGKRPKVYNDDSWGLGNDNLEEYSIVKAEWDS